MKEAAAWSIRLNPLAVQDELRDGALAGVLDDFVRSAGDRLNVDFGVGNFVLGEKAFGFAAIAAPGSGVDEEFHTDILSDAAAEGKKVRNVSAV